MSLANRNCCVEYGVSRLTVVCSIGRERFNCNTRSSCWDCWQHGSGVLGLKQNFWVDKRTDNGAWTVMHEVSSGTVWNSVKHRDYFDVETYAWSEITFLCCFMQGVSVLGRHRAMGSVY